MIGRRHDAWPHEMQPGDYGCRKIEKLGKPSRQETVWFVCTPNGLGGQLSPQHFIEVHEDHTITVEPNPKADPNNSNSILVTTQHAGREIRWHGWIRCGVWEPIEHDTTSIAEAQNIREITP